MIPRNLYVLLSSIVCSICFLNFCQGVYFHIGETEKRCFIEEVPDETLLLINYKLQLPDDAKIHPVFHISLLEPADPETPLQTTFHFQTEEEDEFEVERILEQRGQRYLVKWKGYPHSENTWEPKNNLRNCQKLLQQFQQNRHSRNRKTSRNHRQ